MNLYAMCWNNTVNNFDLHGMVNVVSKTGKCGCNSTEMIRAYFDAIINTPQFSTLIDKIREPFRSAIRSHFKHMTFECRTNADCEECKGKFGFSQAGIFRDIQYRYRPIVTKTTPVTSVEDSVLNEKRRWNSYATLCVDQLGKLNANQWLRVAIHETAHNIGWGKHYKDDTDPSFDNLLPNLHGESKRIQWGIPSGNDK